MASIINAPDIIMNRNTDKNGFAIDISGLEKDDFKLHCYTAHLIDECAKSNGFLYILNHGVSPKLIEKVYQLSRQFFSLPEEEKLKFYVGLNKAHRGYVPTTEKGDYPDEVGPRSYEAFDIGLDLPHNDIDHLMGNPLLGPNVWPNIPDFKETMLTYYQEMRRVSALMFYAFELILHLPNGYFDPFLSKPVSQLRLIHYIKNNEVKKQIKKNSNMGAHTDYECFTILHSATPGLQILSLDEQWIDAIPIENAFYFNIGDMLETWSGGRFTSTIHRVKTQGTERFSVPFFAATNYDTEIYPVVNNINQKKYDRIISGEHLLSQMLRDFPYLLKRYERGELKNFVVGRKQNPFEERLLSDEE